MELALWPDSGSVVEDVRVVAAGDVLGVVVCWSCWGCGGCLKVVCGSVVGEAAEVVDSG